MFGDLMLDTSNPYIFAGECTLIAAVIGVIGIIFGQFIAPILVDLTKRYYSKVDPAPKYPDIPIVIKHQFPKAPDQSTREQPGIEQLIIEQPSIFDGVSSLSLNALQNPDDYPYGSEEYYKALSQRLSLSKELETRISLGRVK